MNMPRLGRLLLRLLPWLCCGVLACAAFVFKFVLPGYSFSALVCCGLIAVILFYTLMPLVAPRLPRFTRVTMGIVTGLLVLGLAAAAVLGSSEAIARCVAQGLGISCLPRVLVQSMLNDGSLVVLPTSLPRMERHFCIVQRAGKHVSAALQAFLDACAAQAVRQAGAVEV